MDFVFGVGHSFGFSAAKFANDAIIAAGLDEKIIGTFGYDGVPNGDRCGHHFSDRDRWHAPGEFGLQIYQRHFDLLPKGCKIVEDATHKNVNVLDDLGHDDDHLSIVTDLAVIQYMAASIEAVILKAVDLK